MGENAHCDRDKMMVTKPRFQTTHPFIKFKVPSGLPPLIWMLLGEAHSKCAHIAMTPIKPELQRQMQRLYLAKGVLATTAIEGNNLSEEEVLRIVDGSFEPLPSRAYQAREVENIIDACNWIVAEVLEGVHPPLDTALIKTFNLRVLEGLEVEDGVIPGEWADSPRVVGRYKAPSPAEADLMVDALCDWLASDTFRSPVAGRDMSIAILKAIFAHLYLAWIHPFGDGNGRTARLVEFLILVSAGAPAPAAHLLSNHYNLTRTEYYRQLDRASQSESPAAFLLYAVQGLVDGLKEQLELIQEAQWDTAWGSYVHDVFRDKRTPPQRRQRDLVLDLSRAPGPVPKAGFRTLSPRIAEAYVGKGEKTLTRDVNALLSMNLIKKTRGGFVTRRDTMLSFRAVRAEQLGEDPVP